MSFFAFLKKKNQDPIKFYASKGVETKAFPLLPGSE